MSQPDPDTAEDTTEEDRPNVELTDPDDYHRKQRLKTIHRRRRHVHTVIEDLERFASTDDHERQRLRLADAVTAYAAELEPLTLRTDNQPEVPDWVPWEDVNQYTMSMGQAPEGESVTYQHHVAVFRTFNRYLAEVKPLIEEDDSDEWEV
jgi:hypothetical protein